jgi:glutathione S-transferase
LAVRFYYASGSPYAWRVWLALERKGAPYHRKTLSFDAGELQTPEFGELNSRRRVPVLVEDDFALAESSAIVEYIEDRWPLGPALFARDPRQRAIQRRTRGRSISRRGLPAFCVGEDTADDLRRELALWEDAVAGHYLTSEPPAVDLTVFRVLALFLSLGGRRKDFVKDDVLGPGLSGWIDRLQALPIVQWAWPPRWKKAVPT